MIGFGIDIGGSGVKGAAVRLDTGELEGDRFRVATPQPSTPQSVIAAASEVVEFHSWKQPLGITIPGVIVDGVVLTAGNIDRGWIDFDARTALSDSLGLPVTVINDADAAGMAEVQYGEHGIQDGVVLVLTFGTGIGSALIHDGVLVPNTELGHLEFHGMIAEKYAAGRLVKRENRDIEWWAARVNEYLQYIEVLFTPRKIIIGGGISKRFEEFVGLLHTRADVVPARLRNNAGIVGAAMIAALKEPR
jgi:polyphosphate glucokinase